MAENKFSVVYTGRIADGENIDDVKRRLSAMFKKPGSVIDRLLKPGGSVIKKGLDKKTAEKYRHAIEKTGAVCTIKSAQPARDIPPQDTERRVEPRVVVVPLIKNGEESFTPRRTYGISGGHNVLVIKADKNRTVAYSEIKAIAAFENNESVEDTINFLFFVSPDTSPLICSIDSISYGDFPIKVFEKNQASFRGFLHFLCSRNPSVILEETTFDFLSGSSPQKLDEKNILKLATGLAQLIESGDAEEHT